MHGERLTDGLSVVTTGEGPPLVFLPGLGPGADLSREVPPALARSARAVALGSRRTVHLISRPGELPSGTTVAGLARSHAVALRDRFDRPVDVLGVSAGGVTALQLAMDHPTVVRRLAIQVAASRVSERGRRDLLRAVERERRGESAAWVSSGLVARGVLRLMTAATYRLGDDRRRPLTDRVVIEAGQDWDVTARLAEISAPTLLVGGSRDVIIPPELIEATARAIPDARLVLLRGRGHLTALFDPRAMRAIRAFLDEP